MVSVNSCLYVEEDYSFFHEHDQEVVLVMNFNMCTLLIEPYKYSTPAKEVKFLLEESRQVAP